MEKTDYIPYQPNTLLTSNGSNPNYLNSSTHSSSQTQIVSGFKNFWDSQMPVELGVFQHTLRTIAFQSPLKTVGHVMLSGSPRGGEAIAALAFIYYQQRNKKYSEPCHLYLLRKVFLFFLCWK